MPIYQNGTELKGLYGGYMQGQTHAAETRSTNATASANEASASDTTARLMDFLSRDDERDQKAKDDSRESQARAGVNEGTAKSSAAQLLDYLNLTDSRREKARAESSSAVSTARQDAADFEEYQANTPVRGGERSVKLDDLKNRLDNKALIAQAATLSKQNEVQVLEINQKLGEFKKENLKLENQVNVKQNEEILLGITKKYEDEALEEIASGWTSYEESRENNASEEELDYRWSTMFNTMIANHKGGEQAAKDMLSAHNLTTERTPENEVKVQMIAGGATYDKGMRQQMALQLDKIASEGMYAIELEREKNKREGKQPDTSYSPPKLAEVTATGDKLRGLPWFDKLEGHKKDDGYSEVQGQVAQYVSDQAREQSALMKGGDPVSFNEFEIIYIDALSELSDTFVIDDWGVGDSVNVLRLQKALASMDVQIKVERGRLGNKVGPYAIYKFNKKVYLENARRGSSK